jgi:hypothetical protein
MRSHRWIEQRSLALHEAVAAKLEVRPELVDVARANLRRWLATSDAGDLREWWVILQEAPMPALLALLRSPDERGARLRQSSPFAGVLTPLERQAIFDAYEPHRT